MTAITTKTAPSRAAKSLFDRPPLGLLYVWATPLVAGLVHVCSMKIGGLTGTGFVWMGMLGLGAMVFLSECALVSDRRVFLPWIPWVPFLGWIWTSLAWCDGAGRENFQDAFLICMPIFVGVIASACVHTEDQLRILLRMFAGTVILLFVSLAGEFVRARGDASAIDFRMGALTATMAAAIVLVGTDRKGLRPWIGWGACLVLTVLLGARAAGAAILAMPILHPTLGRWSTRVALVTVTCLLGLAVFHTPHVQERFFYADGSGSLSDLTLEKINTSGRLEAWPLIWAEGWKHPVVGAGVGTSGVYADQVSDLGGHPHNDYLRVFFELGWVGVLLFAAVLVWQTWFLVRAACSCSGLVQKTFAAALLAWFMFLLTSTTDNTLVYAAAYMNPMFALIGAACGVVARQPVNAELRARNLASVSTEVL